MAPFPSSATLQPRTLVRLTFRDRSLFTSAEATARKVYQTMAANSAAHPASQPTAAIGGGWLNGYEFVLDARIGEKAITVGDFKAQLESAAWIPGLSVLAIAAVSDTSPAARDAAAASAAKQASEGSWFAQLLKTLKQVRAIAVVVLIVAIAVYTWPYWRFLLPKPKASA